MAKLAANINKFVFPKLFLFFISKDLNLHMSFEVVNFSNTITCKKNNKRNALDILKTIKSL